MGSPARWVTDLVMIVVVAIWALNNVVMKAAMAGWVTPGAFNSIRFSLGALTLAGAVLAREGSLRLPPGLLARVALLGLVGNGLNQVLFIQGLAQTTASNAGLYLGIAPVLVALLGGALGLERITLRLLAGALLSFGGIVTVLAATGGDFRLGRGDLYLAGAVLTWTAYTVFARPLAQAASPLRVTAVAMLVAAAGLVAFHLPELLAQDLTAVPAASWLGLTYAAVLSNAAGYAAFVWSVRRIGPARVSLFNNLGPVLTAAGGWYFLGEIWRPLQWFGMALVIGGVLVARWGDLQQALRVSQRSGSSSGLGS